MPSREQTIADAVQVFSNAYYPRGLNASEAWLGIYQTLLWYEPVNCLNYSSLPHIIDSDKLRPSSPYRQQRWTKPSIWQRRAQAISLYLANQLNCSINDVPNKVDLLMKQPNYVGMQRQNSLGIAFVGLLKHVMDLFGNPQILFDIEYDAAEIFPGISLAGRSQTPRIDLLAKINNIPQVVVSAKWSLRHDRMNDITNECPVYKAAYQRFYRQSGRSYLLYYVMTNEYDPSRLAKMLNDPCIDGVVHVHKAAVTTVCNLDGRLMKLIDLADFINASNNWR